MVGLVIVTLQIHCECHEAKLKPEVDFLEGHRLGVEKYASWEKHFSNLILKNISEFWPFYSISGAVLAYVAFRRTHPTSAGLRGLIPLEYVSESVVPLAVVL